MSETKEYSGYIKETSYGEDSEALFVGDDEPIAKLIESEMGLYGKYLTVRYWIGPQPFTKEQAEKDTIVTAMGLGEAEYSQAYSEITGYLWTDAELKIGGHNLLDELSSNIGKYCLLEIEYSRSPSPERDGKQDE